MNLRLSLIALHVALALALAALPGCSSSPDAQTLGRATRPDAKADWPILTLERPPGAMDEPIGTKIDIYSDGRVVKSVVRYVRGSQPVVRETDVKTLTSEIAKIKKCSTELYHRNFEPTREACEGEEDGETQYKSLYAEKEFALRACGRLQIAKSGCAKSMVDLLDSLEKLSSPK